MSHKKILKSWEAAKLMVAESSFQISNSHVKAQIWSPPTTRPVTLPAAPASLYSFSKNVCQAPKAAVILSAILSTVTQPRVQVTATCSVPTSHFITQTGKRTGLRVDAVNFYCFFKGIRLNRIFFFYKFTVMKGTTATTITGLAAASICAKEPAA